MVDATHDYATSTQPRIQLVQPREKDIEYYVDHHDVRITFPPVIIRC